MPLFNFPGGDYSKMGVSDTKPVQPIIGGISFPFQKSYTFPQPQISWHETNWVMPFARMDMAATTERNLFINMRYPVQEFYNCHKKFSDGMSNLINQNRGSQSSRCNFFDPISNIISEYDQHLMHLSDDVLNLFFDYTDLLEAVLLVSKRRSIDIVEFRDILTKLNDNYSKIYSLMMSKESGDISSIMEEISCIRVEVGNQGLLPSDEEYEAEISEMMSTMNDKEKEDLACMLRN